jgi:hypothetical protein
MPRFEPKNPDFRKVATGTFDRQRAMRTLGISIARLEPGEVDLSMAYSSDFAQQNGFVPRRDYHGRARQCLRYRRLHADA